MVSMNNYSLTGIKIPVEEFLRPFFHLDEKVCLRVFSDRPDSTFTGQKLECVLGDGIKNVLTILHQHNVQNRGIYFVINHGGHTDEEINRINAQFMEMDNLPLEEQLVKIQAFPLEPSLIVKTRNSLHCYWLMKNAKKEKFRHIQKRLIAHFNADPACINESRVFRLPGFNHCKEEPILVECIKYNPELRYTQEQLEAVLPELTDEADPMNTSVSNSTAPIRERGTQMGLVLTGKQCAFFQHCKKNAKNLSEPDWYAMITNLAVFEGGEDAIHKLSKPYPKYNFKQTQRKIDHFCNSGTKPMTCARIAEKGFKCPRIKSCKCKSPAGLAFFPLSLTDLKKILPKQKKSTDATTNLQTAQKFISDYLFNQEPSLAEAFIKYDLREYFGYKADDTRPLIASYKEMYGRLNESRTRQRSEDESPKWYRFSKYGEFQFMPGVLATHLAENFRAFYCTEQYYFYSNGVYKHKNDKDAKAIVQEHLIPTEMTTNQINDAEFQWQLKIRLPINEINPNPYIINCTNGLYNVLDDSFKPHDSNYLSTVQIKAKYDPEAKCPRFMEFLYSSLDAPEIHLLQEIFGYFLVPITKAQKSFLLCGMPEVGKSKILGVIQEVLLGAENVSNIPLQNLTDRFQPAELFGKLANIYADLPDKKIDDVGMFKAATGEDYITGERKHKDPFTFKPYARFGYSCNDLPPNYGDRSDAFYRRIIIIRFYKPVPKDKKDLHLMDKLMLEADGILLWAITGLKRLIAQDYQFSETDRTKAETQKYKIKNNNVLAFVAECCVIEPGIVSYRQELYNRYKEFCEESGLGRPVSEGTFNDSVVKANPSVIELAKEQLTRRALFKGVKLAN